MPKLVVREVILAKTETTPGTAVATTGGADYVRVMGQSASPDGIRNIPRDGIASGTMGGFKPLHGGNFFQAEMNWEVAAGSGASSPSPEHKALYEACGFNETISTISTVNTATFALTSDLALTKSVTIAYNQDGSQRQFVGCRAKGFSIAVVTGDTLKCNATFVGRKGAFSDTPLPAVTAATQEPLVVTSVSASVDGITDFIIESMTIDMGLQTEVLPDMTQADGYTIPRITNRGFNITINPEKESFSKIDWFNKLEQRGNVPIVLSIGTNYQTSATGNGRIDITIPRAYVTAVADGDRSGFRTDEITLMPAKTELGNDEVVIAFS